MSVPNVPPSAEKPSANVLYNRANARLREQMPDLFRNLLVEEYQKVGLTYHARKTAEEREAERLIAERDKARETVEALIAKFGPTVVPLRVTGAPPADTA